MAKHAEDARPVGGHTGRRSAPGDWPDFDERARQGARGDLGYQTSSRATEWPVRDRVPAAGPAHAAWETQGAASRPSSHRQGARGAHAAGSHAEERWGGAAMPTGGTVPGPTTAPATSGAKKPRIASIDGLRTLAIVSVLLYHLSLRWFPSGHMGVVMFLVLTGYLVTSSLVREFQRTQTISLRSLWWRRLKRLWPPVAVMIAVVAAVCVLANHVLLTKMRPDIIPSLLMFPNLHYIFSGASYFDQIGGASPITHLWYIGLDAQLVVILPLVLLACLKWDHGRRHGVTMAVLGVLALVSAILMAVFFDPNADPSRVYYGPDTRAFSVLIGAVFAFVWPLGKVPTMSPGLFIEVRNTGAAANQVYARTSLFSQVIGIVCLILMLVVMILVPASSPFFYYGGMVLVSLLTVGLLVTLLAPGSLLRKLFSTKPMTWLGSRSYALYLWHYPIIQLLGAGTVGSAWWLKVIAVVLSLVAAELSYRLVEQAIATGKLAGALQTLRGVLPGAANRDAAEAARTGVLASTRGLDAKLAAGAIACVAVLGIAGIGCAVVPETTLVPKDAIKSTGVAVDHAVDLSSRVRPVAEATVETPAETTTDAPAETPDSAATPDPGAIPTTVDSSHGVIPTGTITLHAPASERDAGVLDAFLIGDSVPGDAAGYFAASMPDGFNDCYIGRQPSVGQEVLQQYVDQGVVGHFVIMACFTNSVASPETLDAIMATAGPDREVYLVGIVTQEPFKDQTNANILDCVNRYENAHYVDWPSVCAGHEGEYLWGDGEHLRQDAGLVAYVNAITNAMAADWLAYGGTIDVDPNDVATHDALVAWAAAAAETAAREAEAAALDALLADVRLVHASPDVVASGRFDPFLIGDSVPDSDYFPLYFPDGYMDGYVGRQPSAALDVLRGYLDQGVVGNVVVVASFSNSVPSPETLDAIVDACGPERQVYLVGIVVPDGFQEEANANIIDCVNRHENAHYVDWPSVCAGHEGEYLWDDMEHLRPEGADAYTKAIATAVAPAIMASGGSVEGPTPAEG